MVIRDPIEFEVNSYYQKYPEPDGASSYFHQKSCEATCWTQKLYAYTHGQEQPYRSA